MRVPISWLKEYVEITLPIEQLAEKLTLAGLEVEQIAYVGLPGSELPWDRDKIFIGQIVEVMRHPNADRLLLATVDYGAGQPITVVTGAPNIKPGDRGQKVALALRGARLYDGHKPGKEIMVLKEATLRGIKNDSMVCSEKELGLSDDHEGILILPDDAPVGTPLADYLGDVVLEIAILPSMARAASILGVAREVAALTGQVVRYPAMDFVAEGDPIEGQLRIEIRNPKHNPRFTASIIRGVTLGPSPFWMQRRLALCGMRPINNVVDISNYVMLELGQPTHAFDLDAVRVGPSGMRTIITRLAEPGETLQTLDGQVRTLQASDILVCDELGPLSLAGVMGGADSEVKATTRNVLFEVATWDNISIRKTARYHNLTSEAAYRFARGVHPSLAMLAQLRALHLLQRYAGGEIARGILDAYPSPAQKVTVTLSPERVNRLLGADIPAEEMSRILRALEFDVQPLRDAGPVVMQVTAPEHRLDIEGEHDLIEEIARIYGYDRLPETLMRDELPAAQGDPALEFEEQVRDLLVSAGLQEVVCYRLTTPEGEARLLAADAPELDQAYVTLANPINPERTVMRHTLLAGMLEVLANNLRHGSPRIALFEVGPVYLPQANALLPDEQPRLAIAMTGARSQPTWRARDGQMDFYDLKGVVEFLLNGLHVGDVSYEPAAHPTYHPGRSAVVRACHPPHVVLGVFGELHPIVRERWALPADCAVLVADFDLRALREAVARDRMIRDLPRFPAVIEDLAIVVPEEMNAAEVVQTIRRAGGPLLREVRLFDVYRGEQVGAGKKSLAYSLTYQADDRTLTDKDVEKMRDQIIRALEGQLGASVRR